MANRAIKVAAIVTSASAFALVSGPTPADATKTVKIASHITIKDKGLKFSGKVSAKNSACDGGRKVTLYSKKSLKLGTATTNSSGAWKIQPSGFTGISLHHFYAKVSKRTEGTAGTIFVCKGATSKTISFHQ
jgi:hypothetical protein